MDFLLIGQEHTKRTDYIKLAAKKLGVHFDLLEWTHLYDISPDLLSGKIVKLDPPSFQTIHLSEMQAQLAEYQAKLQHLQEIYDSFSVTSSQCDCVSNASLVQDDCVLNDSLVQDDCVSIDSLMQDDLKSGKCQFLNSPKSILTLLDKRLTKQILQSHGLATTYQFEETVGNTEQLLALMKVQKCYSVFVKPRFFSGAAGVLALRFNPTRNELILYTSCYCKDGQLFNTKNLMRLTDSNDITNVLDLVLSLDCVVERWHPKSSYNKKSYDLRVVYQFGKIAHIVVRLSGGPITNLHLNNQPLDFESLGLSDEVIQNIDRLCSQAMDLFDGLNYAGIDILLDRDTLKPRIIEMNGQGDLIYQDIFHENKIYLEQVNFVSR